MQQMLWDELAEQKEQGPWGCAEVGEPNLTEANEKEIERKEAEPERVGAEEREREKGEVGEKETHWALPGCSIPNPNPFSPYTSPLTKPKMANTKCYLFY